MGDILWVAKISNIGVLEIPDIYFGVNGRGWARAYVEPGLKRLVPNY